MDTSPTDAIDFETIVSTRDRPRQATGTRAYDVVVAVLLSLSLVSCATGYKRAYIVGSVTKEFVTETHDAYDQRANARLAECDPAQNAESKVVTKSDMDECMGDAFKLSTQDAIVAALATYNAIAIAYSAVLLGCEPGEDGEPVSAITCTKKTFTDAELRTWRGKLIDAAIQALGEFPEAGAKIERFEALVR